MDLFDDSKAMQPLAKRMAPKNLDEYQGQEHLVGKNKPIRMMIEKNTVQSMVFYGAPATGKTGLASIIAQTLSAEFISVNALTLNSEEIKKNLTHAQLAHAHGKKIVLFIDEIHRMTRPKQDAFLEAIELGWIILIGATTENPFFSLQSALRSRILIFEFFSLNNTHKKNILNHALTNDYLLTELNIKLHEDAENFLLKYSSDPRNMLTILETAVLSKSVLSQEITKEELETILQKADTVYDKEQQHYDVISAFIKSIRGSDPDAALYYLALMIESGEDPRFIFRRLLILSSEDVGLAAPDAISVVNSCADAFERVGFPEGSYFLSHAVLFLCGLPKSNSLGAIFSAMQFVREGNRLEIPPYLKDAHYAGAKDLNRGIDYKYPHDYPNHFVDQKYMSENVSFYKPNKSGFEKKIQARYQDIWRDRFSD